MGRVAARCAETTDATPRQNVRKQSTPGAEARRIAREPATHAARAPIVELLRSLATR
jgi:hypothetical protein